MQLDCANAPTAPNIRPAAQDTGKGGGGGVGAVGALRAGQAKGSSRVSVGESVVGGWRAGGYDGAVSEQ